MTLRVTGIVMAIFAALFLTSCGTTQSQEEYAESRRQTLLQMYPVKKTTRKDVETKFGYPPQVRENRPPGGWQKHDNPWIARYASRAEKRINKTIPKLDRYFGGDGLFSVCYCWFYFDTSDRLLAAEWQWSSD